MRPIQLLLILALPIRFVFAMPATDGRPGTFTARAAQYDEVIIAVTKEFKNVPIEGTIDVQIVQLASLVNRTYRVDNVELMLPRPYYGGGLHFKANTPYILALYKGKVVFELSQEIVFRIDALDVTGLKLTESDLNTFQEKRKKD